MTAHVQQTTASGVTASTDLAKHALLGPAIETGMYLAGRRFPYWSVELSGLVPIIVDIPKGHPEYNGFTVGVTDSWVMLVSTRVVDLGWQPPALATVFVHELQHLWQKHSERGAAMGIVRGSHLDELWNIACDMEINDDLRDAGCPFPEDKVTKKVMGVLPEDAGFAPYLTAEEYFALLLKREEQKGSQKGATGSKGQQLAALSPNGCGSGAGRSNPIEEELGLGGHKGNPGEDESSEEGEGANPLRAFEKTQDEADALEERLQSDLDAACNDSQYAGKVPKGMAADAQRGRKRTKVDWKARLSSSVRRAFQFVKGARQANWGRLARRTLGAFMQPTHVDPVVRVMICLDSSGSMQGVFEGALAQVLAVVEAARADVMWAQADAAMQETGTLRNTKHVDNITIKGLGGTDFRPVFDEILKMPKAKRPQVLVYITAGWGPAPERPIPGVHTIWALIGGDEAPCDWGTVVHIPREEWR